MTSSTPARPRTHAVVDSPVGPLTLIAVGDALAGLYMSGQRHLPGPERFGEPGAGRGGELFAEAASQLEQYFDGERTDFDLPLTLEGTAFQRRVWAGLRAIPYGQTISYGRLASWIGQPSASRAVGLANAKNPIGIIVPCHRVVGADGSLTGYGGGIDRKRHLLAHEQRVSGQTLA
jgi:methylated-DNA-[protein]-cysteine S-methyltransferase